MENGWDNVLPSHYHSEVGDDFVLHKHMRPSWWFEGVNQKELVVFSFTVMQPCKGLLELLSLLQNKVLNSVLLKAPKKIDLKNSEATRLSRNSILFTLNNPRVSP